MEIENDRGWSRQERDLEGEEDRGDRHIGITNNKQRTGRARASNQTRIMIDTGRETEREREREIARSNDDKTLITGADSTASDVMLRFADVGCTR
eukprot:9494925-Pyramimonas_sp.AAC.1